MENKRASIKPVPDFPNTPPNAPPATKSTLTTREALDIWEHAYLLYEQYEWIEAIVTFRRLLKQCGPVINRARVWANLGIIRSNLGEYFLAAEAFEKAVKEEPSTPLYWFLLGAASFQLQEYRKAHRYFDACLHLFPEDIEHIDYRTVGLSFTLHKVRAVWNVRQTFFYLHNKQYGTPFPMKSRFTIERLPAGLIFQSPATSL